MSANTPGLVGPTNIQEFVVEAQSPPSAPPAPPGPLPKGQLAECSTVHEFVEQAQEPGAGATEEPDKPQRAG